MFALLQFLKSNMIDMVGNGGHTFCDLVNKVWLLPFRYYQNRRTLQFREIILDLEGTHLLIRGFHLKVMCDSLHID